MELRYCTSRVKQGNYIKIMYRDPDFWRTQDSVLHTQETCGNVRVIHNRTINVLRQYVRPYAKILDVGQRNLLTYRIEREFPVYVHSTTGDLDVDMICPSTNYDIIIHSHTIEHLFNPLHNLMQVRNVLASDGKLILGCPLKPHWIGWSSGHFHEFDAYRYGKLIKRAGFKEMLRCRYHRVFRWKGIRPLLSSLHQRYVISVLEKI